MTRTHYHREILKIALPSILSNITVPLLGLVDLTIVGHLGSAAYIGAIAIGSTIFNMIYWIFAFLRMGTSGMTSHAYGAGRPDEVLHLLCRSLSASGLVALTVLILQEPILQLSLHFLSPTPTVYELSTTYFHICVWGAPAVLGLYSLTGWFIGLQEAKYPLYVAIFQNITNIAASLFFVFGLHAGVSGVALGTVIAQYAGLFLSLWCAYKVWKTHHLPSQVNYHEVFKAKALRWFFTINRDIFLRTLCLVCVTLYFTSAGAQRGEVILAVNALLMQYFTLYSYFMDGFAFAGEALSGQCAGAHNYIKLRDVIRDLFLWSFGVAILFTLCYTIGGEAFLSLLTNDKEVISAALTYLPWAMAIPIIGLAAFTWDGIFIGLTATRYMLISMCTAMIIFFVCFFWLSPYWGNHALWMAFLLYLFSRGAVQHVLYQKKIISLQTNPNKISEE